MAATSVTEYNSPESEVFHVIQEKNTIDELRQAKRETDHFETVDPFRATEMAIEIQIERMRVVEATNARDAVVHRLANACASIRQKNALIEILQEENKSLNGRVPSSDGSNGKDSATVQRGDAGESVESPKEKDADEEKHSSDPPPRYEQQNDPKELASNGHHSQAGIYRAPFRLVRENPVSQSNNAITQKSAVKQTVVDANELDHRVINASPESDEPEDMTKARNRILASLPLPSDVPDDVLKPIIIPSPFTLHEFLGNASGSLKNSLSNYRVFHQLTTVWCPDREEHGYMLVPTFKCSTNPRVATAHRWAAVDVIAKMNKPVECFYNKDGKWYYAGVYKAFRLADLTTKEWNILPTEASQMLVKETLSGRKNTSPQNLYETSQLYAAGALKIACMGLQCVGFNDVIYRAILEQARKCETSGRWRTPESAMAATATATFGGNRNKDETDENWKNDATYPKE